MTRDDGLCATCRHAETVRSARESTFILCGRSRTDPRFPKYPRLPVVRCSGYEPGDDTEQSTTSRRPVPGPGD